MGEANPDHYPVIDRPCSPDPDCQDDCDGQGGDFGWGGDPTPIGV